MRLLAYIYIFIVSGVSFGEIPQIVEHTRLVTRVPSEAKALYRVKVGEVDDETLEYKWFVDGVEQCQESSCVIKAGKRIGKRKKIYLLVTNSDGSSFVRFNLVTVEGEIKEDPYKPRMRPFKKSESEKQIGSRYVTSLGSKGYAYTNKHLKIIRRTVRNIGSSNRLRSGRSPLKFGELSKYEYYLLAKSKLELVKKDDYTIYELKRGGIRFRGLDYQNNYSPSIRVSGINIIGAPQSDFIVKYDQKDDYFKIYVLAGEVDLYRVSNSDFEPWLSLEAGRYVKIFKTDKSYDSKEYDKIERRWLGVVNKTTPNLLNRKYKYETNPYNSAGLINLSKDNQQFDYYKEFPMYKLELLVRVDKKQRDSQWYSDLGKVYYELKWKHAANRSFKKAIRLDESNTLPYFYLGNIAFEDKNFEIAKDRYLKAESNEDIVYTLNSRLGQIHESEKNYRKAEMNYAICYDNAISKEEEVWALKRLTEVRGQLKWDFNTDLSFGYDSNIFRSSEENLPTNAEGINASPGYTAHLALGYKFLNLSEDELSLKYQIDYEGWTEASLSDYSLSHQTLYLSWLKDIYKQLEMSIGIESYGIGSNRALDALAGRVRYEAPLYYRLFIQGYFAWAIDPLPDVDDGFDPILHQTVSVSDRSSRIQHYATGFNDLFGSYLEVDYFAREFTSEFATNQSYNKISVDLGYRLDNDSWLIDTNVGYQNLNFYESLDSRKDSIYDLGSRIAYKFPWHISAGLNLGYESSVSNVSDYTYSRFYTYANMSWFY